MNKDSKERLDKTFKTLFDSPVTKAWVIVMISFYPIQYIIRTMFHTQIYPFEEKIITISFISLMSLVITLFDLLDKSKALLRSYQKEYHELFELSIRFNNAYNEAAKVNKEWIESNKKLEAENFKLKLQIGHMEKLRKQNEV